MTWEEREHDVRERKNMISTCVQREWEDWNIQGAKAPLCRTRTQAQCSLQIHHPPSVPPISPQNIGPCTEQKFAKCWKILNDTKIPSEKTPSWRGVPQLPPSCKSISRPTNHGHSLLLMENHIDWEMFKYFNYISECKEKGEEREAGRVRGGGGGGDVQESDQGLRQ